MSKMSHIGKLHTTITNEAGITKVRYHQTNVVTFNDKEIVLNTGGWFTATTKTRMNQASNVYSLGFTVNQKDGQWIVNQYSKEGKLVNVVKFEGNLLELRRV